MKEWLDKCDKLEKLKFNSKIKIKDGLKDASKGYFPISMEKLKEENRQIYDLVLNKCFLGSRTLHGDRNYLYGFTPTGKTSQSSWSGV
jgi:hypothetical protein